MNPFLGIDLGTTGLKVTLMDASGEIISSARTEYPISSPQKGYAEQDPEHWWSGLIKCCRSLRDNYPRHMTGLLGIGICGQMHTQVYLDGRLNILRPAITWMDQRSNAVVARINRDPAARDLVFRETLNFATTTYTAPHMKWVQENQPDLWHRLRHTLIAKDFLKYRLTGEMVTDYSDAAGTLLFDVAACQWSEKMFDFFGFAPALLPKVRPSDEIIGRVTKAASEQTGIPAGTPVVNGCADHTAASLGAGVTRSGQVTAIIGTAGVISVCSDTPLPDADRRTLCWNYCLRNRWVILGITQTAGESLNWFKRTFDRPQASPEALDDIFEVYNRIVGDISDGSDGLIFLPYLNGERTPHWDPDSRGLFFGIGLSTTKAHFIKAIMEGVCFALRQNVETVERLGITIDEIRCLGGGSKSPIWLSTLAKILRKPIRSLKVRDAGALGSIILCATALDVYPDAHKAVESLVEADEPILLNAPLAVYERNYELFRDLYTNLQQTFKKAAHW
jgi:xylulokinase